MTIEARIAPTKYGSCNACSKSKADVLMRVGPRLPNIGTEWRLCLPCWDSLKDRVDDAIATRHDAPPEK